MHRASTQYYHGCEQKKFVIQIIKFVKFLTSTKTCLKLNDFEYYINMIPELIVLLEEPSTIVELYNHLCYLSEQNDGFL